ncbi:DUF7696 family protein [Pseudoxanthomonas winnipegensis]|uniref:DUF7696 family protein n=1 Tax=Pseudoxanthomonas winnipegensis TaxID=2480810 RepID=UPI003CCDB653
MSASNNDASIEDFRRQCEARHWLAQGYGVPGKIDQLMARISAKRGSEAANALREEMRVQWRAAAARSSTKDYPISGRDRSALQPPSPPPSSRCQEGVSPERSGEHP